MASTPNVVLVVMDTARAQTVAQLIADESSFGALSSDSTVYENAIAPAPWTLPSHASLFTGTYPSKHGAHAGHKRFDSGLRTLAEALSAAGYGTAAVSNNTWISEEFGFGDGFDTFYRTWQLLQTETDLGATARKSDGSGFRELLPRLVKGNPIANLVNAVYGQYLRKRYDKGARRSNRWVRSWLSDRAEEPFFLFINYLEPHLEYRPPSQYAERFLPADVSYEEAMSIPQDAWSYIAGRTDLDSRDLAVLRALYRAEIAYLGDQVAELRSYLDSAGVLDDTLFILTSDHGENIGEHGLMDHQYCLYDTVLRVPLLMHGGPFTGGVETDLVSLVDLVPTILDVCGVDDPITEQVQGKSLVGGRDEETVFAEYLAPQPSMESLSEHLGDIPPDVRTYDRSLRAVRTPTHKYIRGSDGSQSLYDLRKDSDETESSVGSDPEQAAALDDRLDEWIEGFQAVEATGPVEMSRSTRNRLEELGYLQ
jgi:arylsulfatase A-like enzyme